MEQVITAFWGLSIEMGVYILFGLFAAGILHQLVDRITSYNVCYTKLLRALSAPHQNAECIFNSAVFFSTLSPSTELTP